MVMNIFVPGLTRRQRAELATIDHAEQMRFRPLLDVESLTLTDHVDFDDLLHRARTELDSYGGRVDAIVPHWDFPTSVLAPILAAEYAVPAPELTSVLACEHKYWSRLLQQGVIPECVPRFVAFDPFDPEIDHAGVGLEFPFWVKPVKAHSSQLGFEIHDHEQFAEALVVIRREIGGVGDAFDEVLDMVDLPDGVRGVTGTSCLAEEVIRGVQAAPEVSMFRGEFIPHGIFDMPRSEDGHSFDRLSYPAASIPRAVEQRMLAATERFLREVGFDNGCANAEFMWDEPTDRLWMVEVNTRISQSHSELFVKVDGTSNHEYAIDVALGRRPAPGARRGRFRTAAKCLIGTHNDGVVQSVPTADDVERLRAEFPETVVQVGVTPGDRLSELPNQDPYRYVLATVYLGAADQEAVSAAFERARELLPFRIGRSDRDVDAFRDSA